MSGPTFNPAAPVFLKLRQLADCLQVSEDWISERLRPELAEADRLPHIDFLTKNKGSDVRFYLPAVVEWMALRFGRGGWEDVRETVQERRGIAA